MSATLPGADALRQALDRLSPRQRQYLLLATLLGCGLGLLWLVFLFADSQPRTTAARSGNASASSTTTIGVMPAGAQVNPVDQWVGTAGRKLAQYESERDDQARLNKDRQAFEARTLQRFAELEQKLATPPAGAQGTASAAQRPAALPGLPRPAPNTAPTTMPPALALPALPPLPPPPNSRPTWPSTAPRDPVFGASATPPGDAPPPLPAITRITVTERARSTAATAPGAANTGAPPGHPDARSTATFLPVSFTRGTLLGGLDAPTGGQAQSNPQPVLIRLADNSVLPNQFRGQYRDCFVIAAGYGDISSERAYLRTENLSCVRADGATLEVRIQGSVYGEDGKVGMRGRLVTKQGQMLANALLAGVVSGIGQGIGTASTDYSTSALGTVASAQGADAYRAGIGTGVGRALDRLAQYYIKLAENTFPVIEVDAGRSIDVVITKGVRIDVPMAGAVPRPHPASESTSSFPSPATRFLEDPDDDNDD